MGALPPTPVVRVHGIRSMRIVMGVGPVLPSLSVAQLYDYVNQRVVCTRLISRTMSTRSLTTSYHLLFLATE